MVRWRVRSLGSLIALDASNNPGAGLSEEQITDIFSDAGKVERFRLVYDSETGRPKGFGFAEYPDTGTTPGGAHEHCSSLRPI